MIREFAGTDKQQEICEHILDYVGPMPFQELKAKISWECSGPALQCSIRILAQHGFLTRIYGSGRRLYLVPEQKMRAYYGR